MKNKLIPIGFLAVFALAAWSFAQTYTFRPDSKLWITGTSTIHDWEMTATQFAGIVQAASAEDVASVTVTIPVRDLTANNGTMDKKAYDALKVKEYPNVTYKLNTSDLAKAAENGVFDLKTTGELAIAGVTKPVTFTVRGEQLDGGLARYTGSTPLLLSDFGIDPPKAMLGTLKTGNEVTVHFDVTVAQ